MDSRHWSRFWAASARLFPGGGAKNFLRRLRFMGQAWSRRADAAPLLTTAPGSLLERVVSTRPQIAAFVIAPYLCCAWNARDRIAAFARHIATLERFPKLLDFDLPERVELMPLTHLGPDYHLVLDKPIWFHREGAVVLNLFRGNVRLMSLAFALEQRSSGLVALIGAIQGRDIDGIKDEFRQMTKDSFGIRPRDLLIDLFRAFCRQIGVQEIHGIADRNRHHRDPFFKKDKDRSFSLNYDEIWQDRGGEPDGFFFRISSQRQDREAADIPARKRAMYRQRYALLDKLEGDLSRAILDPMPVNRGDAD